MAAGRRRKRSGTRSRRASTRRWSQRVTRESNALDLESGAFAKRTSRAVARSLKRSAEQSRRRKAGAFQSAMSMLNFYINRAGKGLSGERRRILEAAKEELRILYGKHCRTPRRPRRRR